MGFLTQQNQLQVLFCGIGSIGKRHLINLHTLCKQNDINLTVHALRHTGASGKVRNLDSDIESLVDAQFTWHDISKLPHYDVIYITNPTSDHYKAMNLLKGKTNSWFIEKPIFENTQYNINDCICESQKAYIAAPMRFCKTMIELKKILPQLKVYSARVICSSYLPSWRANTDYRDTYSAHKSMGGGVTIDLIHEWDYLNDLFGMPQQVYNFKGKYSHLEIDSDDISIYIAKYSNMLCEVHLDYFGRGYERKIELLCENGTVVADFGKGTLKLEDGNILDYNEDVNERYIRETQYFLNYIFGDDKNSINTPQNALAVLKLSMADK